MPEFEEKKDNEGNSPMHLAVMEGNIALLTEILEKEPHQLSSLNPENKSPVYIAAELGKWEIVEKLVVYLSDNDKYGKLIISYNEYEQLITLANQAKKTQIAQALSDLIKNLKKKPTLLEMLQASRPLTPNFQPAPNSTTHFTLFNGYKIRGKALNLPDDDGNYPLHLEAQDGNEEVLKLLLEPSMVPEHLSKLNNNNESPILMAAMGNHWSCVKFLASKVFDAQLSGKSMGDSMIEQLKSVHALAKTNNQTEIAKNVSDLLRINTPFLFSDTDRKEINDLKEKLTNELTSYHLHTKRKQQKINVLEKLYNLRETDSIKDVLNTLKDEFPAYRKGIVSGGFFKNRTDELIKRLIKNLECAQIEKKSDMESTL